MSALSPLVATEFCKLCNWAYECWLNHRELFDENPRASELQQSHASHAFERLSIISHEYVLLQIAKLHDNAVVAGQVTLSVDYVLRYGGWDPVTQDQLNAIAVQMDHFQKNLRSVRNRLLSHNDLSAVVSGSPLGDFQPEDDNKYFAALQEFVNLVYDRTIGGPYPFNDLVKNEVADFLAQLK
ncbi:AbiU2 domain-containing protein [Azohydromonas lata]|uniref:HEPN AbiU2-like domain-containing protein n=1 Tax=Azohydromonas lata TaxID=45677 RepID=A0ABU5IEJ3_9BURK|nr:hypothetical protein [Azohydromonas lata]MDZ5457542.1 hypothetical protein [Azohydromonas lata]